MERSFHHILMKAYFAMHKSVMAEAQKIGLTSGQPKILELLYERDGVEQKTIAAHCEIEPATVGNLLGRMESAGLIERRRLGGNRRSLYVYLTDAGRDAAARMEEIFAAAEKRALEGVTDVERAELRKMLAGIYDNIAAADRREWQ